MSRALVKPPTVPRSARAMPTGTRSTGARPPRACRVRAISVLVAGCAVLAAACALPVSDQVEELSADDFPEIFLTTTSTTTTTADPDDESLTVGLYFVAGGQLERVERSFPEGITVNQTLTALAEPPLEEEAEMFEDQLVTELLDGLDPRPLELDQANLVYPILLNSEVGFRELAIEESTRARLIASQIACTMAGLTLDLDGENAQVSGILLYDSPDEDADPIVVTDSVATPIEGPIRPVHFDNCQTGTELRAEQVEQAEEEQEEGANTQATESESPSDTGLTTTTN